MTSRSMGSESSSPRPPSTGIALVFHVGRSVLGRPNQGFANHPMQVGETVVYVGRLRSTGFIILLLVLLGRRALYREREIMRDLRHPAEQSFRNMHYVDVALTLVDRGELGIANPTMGV